MFTSILFDVVGPIILMIGIGALLRKKFSLDVGTMSKLNIYFTVPGFIFYTVAYSRLPLQDMGGIVAITVLQLATLGLLIFGMGKLLGVPYKTLAAVALAVMFYNSGNYGLPLAELAYPSGVTDGGKDGGAVQAFVLMTQNLLTFTVGLAIAASAHSGFAWTVVKRVGRLPMIPALLAGLACKMWLAGDADRVLPVIIAKPAQYIAAALVPLALATLGAQLASNPRWPRWKPVSVVLVLRLIFGPIQMAGLLYGLHLLGWAPLDLWGPRGWPAELMILTAAVPTAVNTLLMTLELDGDTNLAADCVFWTTICSCFTIPVWLYVLRLVFGPAG
ncbi:MAG: AEC family transporter [Burkholderiales bacterium]|nr:AEC family transporter [Phycisphaerae bacterium]